jgi:hypothetical protein
MKCYHLIKTNRNIVIYAIINEMGRRKKVEMKPGEVFLDIYLNETRTDYKMLYRFDDACRIWKTKYDMSPPYKNLSSFKRVFYEKIKSNAI